jgi:hypothetical protein
MATVHRSVALFVGASLLSGIDTQTQDFIFNPPRTYGVRLQVSF